MQVTIHSYHERWDICILFLQLVACEITDTKFFSLLIYRDLTNGPRSWKWDEILTISIYVDIKQRKVVYKLNLDLSVEKMHSLIKILDDYMETRVAKGTQDVR